MHYIHVALASGQFDSAGLSQHLAYVTLMLRAPCKTRSKRHSFVFSNSVANVYIVALLCVTMILGGGVLLCVTV